MLSKSMLPATMVSKKSVIFVTSALCTNASQAIVVSTEVHMLSTGRSTLKQQKSRLKRLSVLATTEPHKIPASDYSY